jgi:hypothetical protein
MGMSRPDLQGTYLLTTFVDVTGVSGREGPGPADP